MNPASIAEELAYAQSMDSADDLAPFRDRFVIADPDQVYLDGNSLGRLPVRTTALLEQAVQIEWGRQLIGSWNQGWYTAPQRIGEKIAHLVGAAPDQVIVSDSTSVNLYKLVMAALAMRPERSQVVTDDLNFPSDLYVLQGCLHLLGDRHHLRVVTSLDGIAPDLDALYDAIDSNTALVTLSHVSFKSGYLYDAAALTRHAHRMGALVLWDLSHSAGALPISLDEWEADLAVGCTYKYLNGGPGAPAFLYVRRELQNTAESPIWGWFGQQAPFNFDLQYNPADGLRRFLCGTPPVLSLLAIEPGLDLLLEAGIDRLRTKSVALSTYLVERHGTILASLGFNMGSPGSPAQRGSHISLRHPEGYRINRALIEEMNVIPDFREPDNLRLGLAPLYTRFVDIYAAVERLRNVVVEKRYLHYPAARMGVT